MNFDKEAREAIERIYKLYKSKKITIAEIKKELKKYNKEVEEKIALGLLAIDKELNLTDIELSKLLYNNANKIAYKINAVLNEAKRFNRTYKEASRRIYDGYNSGIELLDAKKVLPKYLYEAIDKKKLAKEIEKLQSKNLKAGYKELEKYLKSGSDKALQNLLYVAYNEKLRYYADRIAKTELHRATTNKRAREYLEDSHVEYVRFEMSSSHPKVDICDYYANIDYGYGAGIIKKEDMVTLPLHPNCHCVYAPYYGKVKKKAVKDPVKKVMDKFNSYDKRQILGSYANVDRYYAGTNPLKIFNEVRPDYPIEKFSVGYNGGMENIEDKIISKFESIERELYNNFEKLWLDEHKYKAHISKRLALGHIIDEKDYIDKTLNCLANAKSYIFAEHKNSWDNICYNNDKSWAVIFNEHGNIMTSYKVEADRKSFEDMQKSIEARITKGVPNEKFRKYFNSIRK